MMGGLEGDAAVTQAGREDTDFMPENGHHPRFIVGGDGGNPGPKAPAYLAGINHKVVYRAARRPTTGLLERLRQVPVVQRDVRRNATRQQASDEPVVEGHTLLVPRPGARRLHPRPSDGEAVGAQPQADQEVQVVVETVVVVARYFARAAIENGAGLATEHVPDGIATPAFARCTLYLKGAGGGTPDETGRKAASQNGRARFGSGGLLKGFNRCIHEKNRCA